jgi:hypothetical protein
MTTTTVTILSAIVAFGKVDKQASNAWNTLAESLSMVRDEATFKSVTSTAEGEYKTNNPRVEVLPGSYRSAKSVCLAAIKAGVALVDEKGRAKGKTAVEKEIKEGKAEKSASEKAKALIASLTAVCDKADTAELAIIKRMVAEMYSAKFGA